PRRQNPDLHLRDDVKFHSGNPLTAADVVWSMRRDISPDGKTLTFICAMTLSFTPATR
ncbi:hypothetical protein C7D71_31285, partial [Klebsiella pneumoniae]